MTKSIPLTQGKFALVDDEDFKKLNKYKWHLNNIYAERTTWPEHKHVYMHRYIMTAKAGQEVDHINGNKLDNRKENLRLASHSQNCKNQAKPKNNTSGYKGVTKNKAGNNWIAQIKTNGKHLSLGRFENIQDAARAYDNAARKYFGEFAKLNFPDV
ncbi:MAG: HNH endonuclease [Alphaproteobacteria bacterium]|nr:HNH endonuclease [Alphaproteobacteria bacterium]